MRRLVFQWVMVLLAGTAAAEVRLNEIQVIGSHNSYHQAPPAAVLGVIGKLRPDGARAWNYTHPSLEQQLSRDGLRQFELDVFADPEGGLFSDPLGMRLARLGGAAVKPFDADGVMKRPGFKVLHVPDIDCWSNVPTLPGALQRLSEWSVKHPGHLPVMVLIECKDEAHPPLPTRPVAFTRERLLELEAAIGAVFPPERLLRPDEVRRGEATLPRGLARHGWPALKDVRGRFLFMLDNTGVIRDRYLEGNAALEGRLMFASAPADDHPAAAWFKCNDPKREFERIQGLVKRGFLVRTRSDSGEADPEMRRLAFESGAQWVSTDHFAATVPEPLRVVFDGGRQVRANPLIGKATEPVEP